MQKNDARKMSGNALDIKNYNMKKILKFSALIFIAAVLQWFNEK